jgi:hypothetical protein
MHTLEGTPLMVNTRGGTTVAWIVWPAGGGERVRRREKIRKKIRQRQTEGECKRGSRT